MADRNHLKVVDTANIAEDDPFAELTRIMGFDPREPVRQTPAPQKLGPLPAAEAAPAPAHDVPDEDFEIDLERELLGEFDAAEPASAEPEFMEPVSGDFDAEEPAPVQSHYQPAAAPQDETAQAGDEIPDFNLDLADEFDGEAEPVAHVSTGYPEPSYAPEAFYQEAAETEAELDFSAEFDAAMLETDFNAVEPALDFPPADLASAEATEVEEPVAVGPEPAFEASYEEPWNGVAAARRADEAYGGQGGEDLPLDDSDFDLDPALDVAMDDAFEVEAVAYDEPAADEAYAEPEAIHVEPPAPPPAAPEPRFNFEEELRALLGGGAAAAGAGAAAFSRSAPQPQAAPVRTQGHADAAPVDTPRPQPQAAAFRPRPAETPQPADHTHGLEWMLEDDTPGGAADNHFEDPLDLLANMVRPDVPASSRQAEAAQAQDDLPGFDADAFADALEVGVEREPGRDGDRVAAAESVVEEITAEQTRKRADGKRDPLDVINSLTAKYSSQAGKLFYGRATPVAPRETAPAADHAPSVAAAPAAPAYAAVRPQPAPEPVPEPETGFQQQPAFEPQVAPETALAADDALPADEFELLGVQDFDDIPEIETIEVSDRAVALPDDLDIPDVPFDEDRPAEVAFDDLDTEFASLLSDMNAGEPSEPAASGAALHEAAMNFDYDGDSVVRHRGEDADGPNGGAYRHADFEDPLLAEPFDLDEAMRAADEQDHAADAAHPLAADAGQDGREDRSRRGLLIAAVVGGVALVGAIGAYALSFGGGGSDVPVLVSADEGPVKVRPENPGGTRVPNQNNQVYDAARGQRAAGAPQQDKLVTTAEEPVDVTPTMPEQITADSESDFDEDALADGEVAEPQDGSPMAESQAAEAQAPSAKNEDRISQIVQDSAADPDTEIAAVAPRKVRTMVVRPDGTLAPREVQAPVAQAPAQPAPQPAPAAAGTDAVAQMAAAQVRPAQPRAQVSDNTPAQPAMPRTTGSTVPDRAPIAPQRPSEQPVQVVGEVKPDRVAAVTNGAAAGGWAMQIASQPTEEAARSSYQALARRYGNVLGGKDVSIVKAEIAGKGTFWRVRVNAPSRNEAVSLCETYKAAGGTCFVSR